MKRIRLKREKYERLKNVFIGIATTWFIGIPLGSLVFIKRLKTSMPVLLEWSGLTIICTYIVALLPYILYIRLFDIIFEINDSSADDV